jgi:hypothetical protein
MITDTELAKRVDKLVDAGYFLGDTSKGWDCLNSLAEIYDDRFPREFKDWGALNYAERWSKDPVESRRVLEEFLSGLGVPVQINYRVRGDLILVETPNPKSLIPVIDLGQGHGLIISTFGCRVLPIESLLRLTKSTIKSVRRLL